MASILKVDTIQDQDGNNIINESANTITIGASGDTITIPSGATFASVGIDDNATSTAITIRSNQNVGIGTTTPVVKLEIKGADGDADAQTIRLMENSTMGGFIKYDGNINELQLGGYNSGENTGIRIARNDATTYFNTNGSERMRITSGGLIGIGTSSPDRELTVGGVSNARIGILSNDNVVGASQLQFGDPDNSQIGRIMYEHDANKMTFWTNNTERMRIDSTGKVGIGTSSPSASLDVVSTNYPYIAEFRQANAGNSAEIVIDSPSDSGARPSLLNFETGGVLKWSTGLGYNDTTRSFIISTSSLGSGITDSKFSIAPAGGTTFNAANGGGAAIHLKHNEGTNPYGMLINFTALSPDNNTNYYLKGVDSTTDRFFIYSDGDVKNHDNSYGAISDERIKQDIRDSNSQWNDIKAVRVRNFKKKDDVRQYGENAWEQIGVIAQELETVSPKLIKHSDPTPSDILSDSTFGTLYQEGDEIPEGKNVGDVKEVNQQVKGVSYSVLYMKSIKALQEAMERIETLEAKVQTLENNQP